MRLVGGTGPDATRFMRIGNISLTGAFGSATGFFSRIGALAEAATEGFFTEGFATALAVGFFAISRGNEVGDDFFGSLCSDVACAALLAAALGVVCLGVVDLDIDFGGVLGSSFPALERGDTLGVVFLTGLRDGVTGAGFTASARGGVVVADCFISPLGGLTAVGPTVVAGGEVRFDLVVRGGVVGVVLLAGAFEGVL